mmetsp:Transcript_19963/g.56719  ORF Transcript_19963/g.56719 Transcript_19963/m.56719 type:complete len:204 (+) Transcript_19963:1479-2090(+)
MARSIGKRQLDRQNIPRRNTSTTTSSNGNGRPRNAINSRSGTRRMCHRGPGSIKMCRKRGYRTIKGPGPWTATSRWSRSSRVCGRWAATSRPAAATGVFGSRTAALMAVPKRRPKRNRSAWPGSTLKLLKIGIRTRRTTPCSRRLARLRSERGSPWCPSRRRWTSCWILLLRTIASCLLPLLMRVCRSRRKACRQSSGRIICS